MALPDSVLTRLYAAAGTSDAAARRQGASYSLANLGGVNQVAAQRKKRLQQALASGAIKTQQLGPMDASLLGVTKTATGQQNSGLLGKIFGGVGGFIGNMGSDIWQAAKYIPAGLYTVGKDVVQAGMDPLARTGAPGHGGQLKRDIVDPTLGAYADTYGHGPGHFFKSFYEHPLGPVLDAATILSLGGSAAARGGGALARASEPGSVGARLGDLGVGATRRSGREPLVNPVTGLGSPREYTPRPVAKLGQVLLDKAIKTGPEENRIGRFMRQMDSRKGVRWRDSQRRAGEFDASAQAMMGLEAITKLTPDEAMALTLAQKGINTPDKIQAYQRMVHETSIDDPAAMQRLTNRTGVSEDYIRQQGVLPDRVKALILQPSDRMLEAHQVWKERVIAQQEQLGLSPEVTAGHIATEQDRLAPFLPQADHGPAHIDADGRGVTAGGVRLPEEQSRALFDKSLDQTQWRAALDAVAHNPQPGTVIWRGDQRAGDAIHPKDALQEGVGIHWTVSPDAVLKPFPDAGTTNIIWEAVVDDPANQTIPRSRGAVWEGKYRSAAGEFEVRVQPQSRIRIVGAYVYKGEKGKTAQSFWQFNPEKGHPGWEFVPVHATTDVRHLGHATRHPSLTPEGPVQAVQHAPIHDPGADYPIEHLYVPSENASGFNYHEPSRLAQRMTDAQAGWRRGPTDTAAFVQKGKRYEQDMFVPTKPAHDYASTGETFSSGAMRTDARLYLDHVAKRARENAEEVWKRDELNRVAARDEAGDMAKFKNQTEVDAQYGKGKMVFVNDDMPTAYFRKEYDALQRFQGTIEKYLESADSGAHYNPATDPALNQLLEQITETDAKAFISTVWGSMKRKGVAIPADEFNYRMRMSKASEPFTNPMAKFLSKWMYRWRTAVLTLMPRWGINTALGSMVMNTIRGVNPHDYWVAQRLNKAGFLPDNLASETQTRVLPTGANLGHQATQELLEAVSPGHGQGKVANFFGDLGVKVPVQQMASGVQNIENFFRRAQFVHNLKREQRLALDTKGRTIDLGDDGVGQALGGIGDELNQFYAEVLGGNTGKLNEALSSPTLVERALKETDKMSYNYSVLGPAERRILRQFVPFWGWYKFISMAAYRMPVELPGRSNFLRNLSAIGAANENQYGFMPEWVKGAIPFGLDKKTGRYNYLSTMGMNPFSQVFNPFGPQGVLQGAIQLGQFNPLIQAGMSAYGLDPLSGDQVAISPESGVGTDFFGRLWKNGRQVNPATSGTALQRFGMGLLRSFPEYRIGETAAVGPQYPESIPFIPGAGRQMAPKQPFRTGSLLSDIGISSTGLLPKSTSLVGFQSSAAKGSKYAERQRVTAIKRLRRKNAGK